MRAPLRDFEAEGMTPAAVIFGCLVRMMTYAAVNPAFMGIMGIRLDLFGAFYEGIVISVASGADCCGDRCFRRGLLVAGTALQPRGLMFLREEFPVVGGKR